MVNVTTIKIGSSLRDPDSWWNGQYNFSSKLETYTHAKLKDDVFKLTTKKFHHFGVEMVAN